MVTLNIITEQINRLYSRYIDKDNSKLDDREIRLHVCQVVNTLFKLEHLNGFNSEAAIGVYNLTSNKGETDYVKLPVSPISLPEGQGVHRVYKTGCPWKPYIPIRSGDFDVVQGTVTEFLEGQVGYYREGMFLRFTRSIPDEITVKLIVSDPSKIGGNDPLPIPSDMELEVIKGVFQLLGLGQISQSELNSKNERTIENERERS